MKKKKAASPRWVFIQENYLGGMDWQDLASKMGGGQLRKIIVDPKKKKILPRSSDTWGDKAEGRHCWVREYAAFFWGGGGIFTGTNVISNQLIKSHQKQEPSPNIDKHRTHHTQSKTHT